jgi:CheY-like chemotaxis protein
MDALHALVIEDEALVALVIEETLRGFGFCSVDCVSDAEGAWRAFSRQRPALVTADCRLPNGLNGLDLALQLVAGTTIPVVAITGTTFLTEAHPQVPVLPKPFEARQLAEVLMTSGIRLPRPPRLPAF